MDEARRLAEFGIVRVRAENPSPLTLSGTNTWVVRTQAGTVVIDPGPLIEEHLAAIERAAGGSVAGIALTHRHADHDEAAEELAGRLGGVPVAAVEGGDVPLADGAVAFGLDVVATPGHAPDHVAFVIATACFSGDAVLGEGSVFVADQLGEYLAALERLRALALAVVCPGHGPAIWDPDDKLAGYVEHRLDRERKLVEALDAGRRSEDELLDAAWSDVPEVLRPAAAWTLRAHLGKLRAEGRLPPDVQ